MGISTKTTSGKILASVALIGTAAAVAGMGTYGGFTDSTTTVDQTAAAGTVNIDLTASDANTLNVPVTDLLPGDSVEKFVAVANTGTSDSGTITLTTTGTGSKLTTDTGAGLQLAVEACSVPWSGSAGAYQCTPGSTIVLGTSPIIGQNILPANLKSLSAQGKDYLKITTSLPGTADNSFQGLTDTVSFTFTATQRTAQAK